MTTVDDLRRIAKYWQPEPLLDRDRIDSRQAARFAAMLDQPSPATLPGDALPPLWHWFFFLPIHRQQDLGDDGHPKSDPLVPPIPNRRRVFGGGRVAWRAPLRVGDEVHRCIEVVSKQIKQGRDGPLLLVTTRCVLTVAGEERVVEEQDIIYLLPASSNVSPTRPAVVAGHSPVANGGRGWHLAVDTDPVLLFRFSALTGNSHRIHYDRPYTREIEGHPDVLVHGPLTALLLLELPRRFAPDRPVRQFDWRAKAPMYVGETVHVTGAPGERGWRFAAGSSRRHEAVVASAAADRGRPVDR